jgi:hypothetical protein
VVFLGKGQSITKPDPSFSMYCLSLGLTASTETYQTKVHHAGGVTAETVIFSSAASVTA